MARVKPRAGAKRRRSSSSGCSEEEQQAEEELEALQDELASGDEQQQQQQDSAQPSHQPEQQQEAASDSSYEPEARQWQQQQQRRGRRQRSTSEQPAGPGRTRPRKRKPNSHSAAADEQAEGRPGKRSRRSGARAAYKEDDDDVFEYAFASSSEEEEHAHGTGAVDHNESHCAACGSDADADKLLCCERCPAVYHLYCLDPPLARVPRRSWLCPLCAEADHLLEECERVLAVRNVQHQQQAEEGQAKAAADGAGDQQAAAAAPPAAGKPLREFYVKWRERAYLHCSWVAEHIVNRAAAVRVIGQANPVVQRLRRFWRDQAAAAESGELEEAEETGQLVHGINPAWTQVDRVLAEQHVRGGSGEGVQYLVSWKQLPLDQATWEAEEDLADFSAEIAAYHAAQVPISAEAAARAKQQRAEAKSKAAAQQTAEQDSEAEGAAAAAASGERGAGSRKFTSTPAFVAGGPLHPYQLEGLNWLYHKAQLKDNVILADEMGLGKTIQTIAFLGALWKDCVKLPHLVVVPLTTLNNWERELSTWAPYLTVVSLHGSAAARQLLVDHCFFAPAEPGQGGRGRAALQDRVKFHVLLTTYEMVSKHLTDIRRLDWAALVVDEAHRLKNATSRLFQDLVRVNAQHRLLLTGTPLQNSLEELFFLMNFLEPTKFPSVEVFKETYAALDDKDKVSELHRQLAPHLLRRLKKDVLKQLPPKMEQIVRVELSEEQRQLYKAILSKNYDALVDKSKSVVRLRNVMMELRKAVNHPCLLNFDLQTPAYIAAVARRKAAAAAAAAAAKEAGMSGAAAPRACEETEQLVAASGKLALLDKMMARLHAAGHRVLIYSQFTRTLDVLEDWITGRGWGYERIDGDVAGLERQRRVDAFNNNVGGNKFVFLLSTRAGGLGINLATADTVIIYDSDWNPHNDLQALARAHRMGQRRSVMVFRLVCRATVEERMLQRAKSKLVLEHLVVAKAAKSDKLAQTELDDILRYGAKELFAEDEEEQQAEAAPAAADGRADGAADTDKQAAVKPKGHMRIAWDDAAIDRLLDRNQVEAAAAAAAGEDEKQDDEFTKAFKVANFDMVVDEEPAEPEQPQAAAADGQAAAEGTPGGEGDGLAYDPAATELHKSQQAFWAAILGERPEGEAAAAAAASEPPATAALGQRRARNAARYIFFDSESETGSGSEGSGSEGPEEQSEGEESAAAKRRRGRRKKRPDDDDVEYEAVDEHTESEDIEDDADLQASLTLRAPSEPLLAAGEAITAAAASDQPQQPKLVDRATPQQDRLTPQPQADRLATERAAAAAAVAAAVGRPRLSAKPAANGAPAAAGGAGSDAAAVQQQQPPPPQLQGDLPLRVEGSGGATNQLLICGLNYTERHAFMHVFMHFGPPFIHKQPNLGWAPFEQHLPGKSQKQLAAYMLVLLEHLDDCAADPASTHGSYDYLPHAWFFMGPRGPLSPVKIWERLTALHLLAQKLWDHGGKPPAAFVLGGRDAWPAAAAGARGRGRAGGVPLYRTLSCRPGGWGPAQDFDMVRGIFLAGYESWLKVLSLPAMASMRRALRIELNIDPEYDSDTRKAEAAAGPAGATPEQWEQHVQAHNKILASLLKKEVDWLDRRAKHFVTALRQEAEAERQARLPPTQQQQQQQQQHKQPVQVQTQQLQQPRPTREEQAAAQRHAAQLAAQVKQQQQQQQQQRMRVLQPQVPPQQVTSAGSSWRADLVRMYNGMKVQLQRIKQDAQTAMRSDRPDDPNSMQNAAEKFRASVKQLQQQASTMEAVLRSLLPQQQPVPGPAAQQQGPGAAPQQGMIVHRQQPPRPVVSTSQQQQQQQQAILARQQPAGMRPRHLQPVTTAVQPSPRQLQQRRPPVQQEQQQGLMHQGQPAQLQQPAPAKAQQPSSPDVVVID